MPTESNENRELKQFLKELGEMKFVVSRMGIKSDGEVNYITLDDYITTIPLIRNFIEQERLQSQIEILKELSVMPVLDNYTNDPNEIVIRYGEAAGEYKWLYEVIADLEQKLKTLKGEQ